MEQVGYYCSEKEITSVKFLTYSILMVVLEKDKIIILNTRDFIQGKVEEITHEKQPHEVIRSFKEALCKSQESELESKDLLSNLMSNTLYNIDPKTGINYKSLS